MKSKLEIDYLYQWLYPMESNHFEDQQHWDLRRFGSAISLLLLDCSMKLRNVMLWGLEVQMSPKMKRNIKIKNQIRKISMLFNYHFPLLHLHLHLFRWAFAQYSQNLRIDWSEWKWHIKTFFSVGKIFHSTWQLSLFLLLGNVLHDVLL